MKKILSLLFAFFVSILNVFAKSSGKIIGWGDTVCSPSVTTGKIIAWGDIICSAPSKVGSIEWIVFFVFLGIISYIIYNHKNK